MALQGMVVIEDASISWTNRGTPDGKLFVTVTETAIETDEEGRSEILGDKKAKRFSGIVDGEPFMKAVATALTWEGDVPNTQDAHLDWWRDVEEVAKVVGIRFMP